MRCLLQLLLGAYLMFQHLCSFTPIVQRQSMSMELKMRQILMREIVLIWLRWQRGDILQWLLTTVRAIWILVHWVGTDYFYLRFSTHKTISFLPKRYTYIRHRRLGNQIHRRLQQFPPKVEKDIRCLRKRKRSPSTLLWKWLWTSRSYSRWLSVGSCREWMESGGACGFIGWELRPFSCNCRFVLGKWK